MNHLRPAISPDRPGFALATAGQFIHGCPAFNLLHGPVAIGMFRRHVCGLASRFKRAVQL
jgi:hypothetical protein